MRRSLSILVQLILTFAGLAVLGMAFVIWRLSSSPVNSAFLTPYIEGGIERYIPDTHVQIAHTLLTWDSADHSMALHADGLVIKNARDQMVAEVPNFDIRLSLFGLLIGQFWPMELTIDHPQLKLDRHADGRLYFAAMAAGADAADTGANTREIVQNTLRNLTHAYAMRRLQVLRAAIAIHDDVTNRDWSVSVPEISLMRTFTQLVGSTTIDLTQKEGPASLELRYAYDPIKGLHRVSTRFHAITPAQLAGGHPETLGLGDALIFDLPLSGEAEVAFDSDLDIAAAATTLHGDQGVLRAPVLWDHPRSVASFDVEGDFDAKTHRLNLVTAAFDFGGPTLNMTGSSHAPADAKHADLDFILNVTMQNWPMDDFANLWPKPIIPNARGWMAQNLKKGTYDKGEGIFHGSLAWNDIGSVTVSSGQGHITASHGTVSYIEGMPPVENVRVAADFDLDHMTLALSDGTLGNLRMQPFTATITGLSDTKQFIDLPLKVQGPVTDVLKLIDNPPLHYASAVGLSPDDLSGTAEGTVNLHLPLLKVLAAKDVDVTAEAVLTNIASSKLMKGLNLSDGDLNLDLDKDGLSLEGGAAIEKIPVRLAVHQRFEPQAGKPLRQVDVSGSVKDEAWKRLGDSVAGTRGSAMLELHLTTIDKIKTLIAGTLDLTSADLHFAPLNWKKAANIPATLHVKGEMVDGKGITLTSIALRGSQAYADGKAVVGADGAIKSASLQPLRLGRTSANIAFTQSDEGALRFEAYGKSLDVAGMAGGREPARADPRPKEYRLKVDKLFTSDKGVVAEASGFAIRDSEGWSSISLHGLADGEHKVAIELVPKEDGTRDLSLTCDDFGKMLKGLGMTDTVKEGEIKIIGGSTPEHPRVIQGTVKIGSFTVTKLPVLMLLLNATSPFGFVDLVTDQASFDRLKGNFRWSGDEVDLIHVNAPGSSVGMNIDGKVDMNSGRANLHGTVVPFSMVNKFLSWIPLIGDVLTGGDGGGVLAVAYTVKGSLSDPKIGVNPVSLLTPGFLRNLFFGESDDEPAPDEGGVTQP